MDIFTSSTGSSDKKLSRGYTMIEMVVAISIIVVIATVALSYTGDTGRQILLLRTQSQIVGLFNRAKSLTQNFQLTPPPGKLICSYGVHVERSGANAGQFFIFQDLVLDASNCGLANNSYDVGDQRLTGGSDNFKADTKALEFVGSGDATSPDLNDVVFIPPSPDVRINDNGSISSGSVVMRIIETPSAKFDVRVNTFAQITVQ